MNRKLSVIITTFNEEENIARCLESVADLADDILIVDSYSTDKTVETAQGYPVRIEQRKYQGPADQKNWAIPQAQHEWILTKRLQILYMVDFSYFFASNC